MAEPPSQLRVVFTGHTGLGKDKVLDTLRKTFIRHHRSQDVRWYSVEEDLDIPQFLKRSPQDQQADWKVAIHEVMRRWSNSRPQPKYAFLSMHLTFYFHSHVFSPLSWSLPSESSSEPPSTELEDTILRYVRDEFRPHYFITLIDDIQAVQSRIKGHTFLLRDLLKWRNVEVMMTDILAKYAVPQEYRCHDSPTCPYERSPIVAIRHPPEMLYRLLMRPDLVRVYASFPIGGPRRLSQVKRMKVMDEINQFRLSLHRKMVVFDPVTIDELPLQKQLAKVRSLDTQHMNLPASAQWSLPGNRTLCQEERRRLRLRIGDVKEIATRVEGGKSEIERHVEKRDYRLIDQADCVVIYRPTYEREDGDWSTGTYHEALYATARGKPILVIRDPEADGDLIPGAIGMELSKNDYYEKTSRLSNPFEQKKALAWLSRELNRRRENLVRNRRPTN